jgi:hypothetical protein
LLSFSNPLSLSFSLSLSHSPALKVLCCTEGLSWASYYFRRQCVPKRGKSGCCWPGLPDNPKKVWNE